MAALVASIVAHALGGAVAAFGLWAVGCGALRWASADVSPLHAYGVGLAIAIVASASLLLSWWLAPVALVLVVLPLTRASFPRRALEAAARAAPGALGAGVVLGLLLHGPTRALDSHAYGDLTFYAAR